jgi:hypothetical protein
VDTGFTSPKTLPFSFEVVPPSYPDYAAIADFEARVARLRGQPQTKGFLNTGLRLRDLEFLQPSPMPTVDVSLLGSGALSVVDEIEAMPSLISSVWKKPDETCTTTKEVGVAMVNHSDADLPSVSFTFDPAAYGMRTTAPLTVYETDADNPTVELPILTFTGVLTTALPGGVESEDVRFFRIVDLGLVCP